MFKIITTVRGKELTGAGKTPGDAKYDLLMQAMRLMWPDMAEDDISDWVTNDDGVYEFEEWEDVDSWLDVVQHEANNI